VVAVNSGPAGLDPLAGRDGEAHPLKRHVSETISTSARAGLVPGEGTLVQRRALICVFDNAACHAAFMPYAHFEELRTAAGGSSQARPIGIEWKVLETAGYGTPEPIRNRHDGAGRGSGMLPQFHSFRCLVLKLAQEGSFTTALAGSMQLKVGQASRLPSQPWVIS